MDKICLHEAFRFSVIQELSIDFPTTDHRGQVWGGLRSTGLGQERGGLRIGGRGRLNE